MYNYQANDPTTLTDSSLTNFLKAKAAFKNEDKNRRDEEAKVCHLILSSLCDEAQMHLRSVVAFTKATDDNDSYAKYSIAKDENSRSSSFAVAQSNFQQLLNIKKTGTFVALIHDLTDHRRKFCTIFEPDKSSAVKTNDLFLLILGRVTVCERSFQIFPKVPRRFTRHAKLRSQQAESNITNHLQDQPSYPPLLPPRPSPSELNVLSATRCSIKPCAETGRNTPTAIRATPRPVTPSPIVHPPLSIRLLRKS